MGIESNEAVPFLTLNVQVTSQTDPRFSGPRNGARVLSSLLSAASFPGSIPYRYPFSAVGHTREPRFTGRQQGI